MLLEASDPEIFAVKVEVDFYFEMEEVEISTHVQATSNSLENSIFVIDFDHLIFEVSRF